MPGLRQSHAFRPEDASGKIKHVVIIIQENRTFNNLFMNYPGARTATYGYNAKGRRIKLYPIGLATTWDLEHAAGAFIKACNGTGGTPGTNCRMNGFDREARSCGKNCPIAYPPYSYVPRQEVQPYWNMAKQYVLADETFASDFDISSFIGHQYLIAATNPKSSYNYPFRLWGCPGGPADRVPILGANRNLKDGTELPCWDPKTLADEIDTAGLSWAYYAGPVRGGGSFGCRSGDIRRDDGSDRQGLWSAYQAIKHICYGPDWDADVISPPSQFLNDIAAGKLRNVTWITPTCANSDHSGCDSDTGPSWVTSLVNAIGQSKFWDSTAIFILWDDPGGWFDPVAPRFVDNDGLGFRVPLLIISPYAKQNHVSHVNYEFGSVLKFTEDQFDLGRLGASDTRAESPAEDCFDFARQPRKFVSFMSKYKRAYFLHQPSDLRPPDTQ
jgi:phospholipase C